MTERTEGPKTGPGRLERGRLLFNEGRYFEAHEAWEEEWLVEEGAMKVLLQGLIQLAAGCHKAGEGQAAGCARLIGAGLEKVLGMEKLAPEVAGFARAMAAVHERAVRWQRGESGGIGPVPELPPWPGPGAPAR